MKIFFEDGLLYNVVEVEGEIYNYFDEDVEIDVVEAAHGVSYVTAHLNYFNSLENAAIYTNSILALDNKYAWNEELEVPEVYIRVGKHLWKRIDALTDRELREGHNLAKLYLASEFE